MAKEQLASYLSSCLVPGGGQEVGEGVKVVHGLLQGEVNMKTEVKTMEDFIKNVDSVLPKKSPESPVREFPNLMDKTKTGESDQPVINKPDDDEEGEVKINRSDARLTSVVESDDETENEEDENEEQIHNPNELSSQNEHPVTMLLLPVLIKDEPINKSSKLNKKTKLEGLDKFKCKDCGKGFPFRSAMFKHEKAHHGLRSHPCRYCAKKFDSNTSLNNHQFKRHLEDRQRLLEHLKMMKENNVSDINNIDQFDQDAVIDSSETTQHSQEQLVVKTCGNKNDKKSDIFCKNCGKDFINKSRISFHRHFRACPVIQFSCECPGASETSIRDKRLHMVSVHNFFMYWCASNTLASCLKIFDSTDALEVHTKEVHGTNVTTNIATSFYKKFATVCLSCRKDFKDEIEKEASRIKFKQHIRKCPVKLFSCECSDGPDENTQFDDKHNHMIVVHSFPLHWCKISEQCFKTFATSNALETHISKYHGKQLKPIKKEIICFSCGKIFFSQNGKCEKFKRHARVCPVEMFTCGCPDVPEVLPGKNVLQSKKSAFQKKHKHIQEVHKIPFFWCPDENNITVCLETFASTGALEVHLKRGHNPTGKTGRRPLLSSYLCPDCGKDYKKDPKGLKKLGIHVNKCRIERFSCECPGVPIVNLHTPTTTNNHKKKAQHMQVFHFGQHGCMEAVDCFMYFETKKDLEMHITEKHKNDSHRKKANFECNECGKHFNRLLATSASAIESIYKRHMETHEVENFNCDCLNAPIVQDIKFGKSRSKYFFLKQKHIRVEHLGWQGCPNCAESFKDQDVLSAHLEKHNQTFICDLCGYVAKVQSTLASHTRRDHESNPTKCTECSLILKNDYWIAMHMANTHLKKKTTCEECGKEYMNIKDHMMTVHTADAEKEFPCSDCDKGFVRDYLLRAHQINVHIKSRPHHCRYDGCKNRYNDSGNLNAHEKRRHGKIFGFVPNDSVVGVAE